MSRRVARRPFRIHAPAEYQALGQRLFGFLAASRAEVQIVRSMELITDFIRGDIHMMMDLVDDYVSLEVEVGGRRGRAQTNQLDDGGLQRLVSQAEANAREGRGSAGRWELLGPQRYPTPPKLVFESVLDMTQGTQANLATAALEAAEAAGLIGAGDLHVEVYSGATMNTAGFFTYYQGTYGEFSLTARTPDDTGSGWAWGGHEDWARVDARAVAGRAIDLARRSANPVAVEPGRYTVILEPAAVAELLDFPWDARRADAGGNVFSNEPVGTNKIGLKMMDERLGIVSDPWDPAMPRNVVAIDRTPLRKVAWFERGVLKHLEYDRDYAREQGREPVMGTGAVRLTFDGPTQTLEEMIASTKRGIWVNRLSSVAGMNARTLLLTGTTRDGTFLIENGKITKPIKNLRFTESPFFVLNKLEAAGEPVRASRSVITPRLKVRDFHFTSMTDAV